MGWLAEAILTDKEHDHRAGLRGTIHVTGKVEYANGYQAVLRIGPFPTPDDASAMADLIESAVAIEVAEAQKQMLTLTESE